MGSAQPQRLHPVPSGFDGSLPGINRLQDRRAKRIWRRLVVAFALVLACHLFFFAFVAPHLDFEEKIPERTEVIQISPQQLADIKKQIQKDKYQSALLQQEVREEYKSNEAPKDARMIGPHNQIVPKEQVVGAQPDAPQLGGGGTPKPRPRPQTQSPPRPPLNLGALGLGNKVPKPIAKEELQRQLQAERAGPVGPPGPGRGPHREVGRDDKNVERGEQNLLNAIESKFYSFFVRLEEPIIRNWFFLLRSNDRIIRGEMASRRILAGSELPITIEFVLDRQGNFRSIEVIESSGIPKLDAVTQQSVQKLGTLPNPPEELFEGGQYYTRRLRFMVHVTDAPVIDSRPDLYW